MKTWKATRKNGSHLVLGLSAYYHDAAAALLRDGEIVAAAQEERFTRVKGDSAFPHRAIGYCLDQAQCREDDLDTVVFYENPLPKFDRLLTMYHITAPNSLASFLQAMPSWLTQKLWLQNDIRREMGVSHPILFCDHHLSHAASAFFPSPFEQAAVLTIDGVGEWTTAAWGIGQGNALELREHLRFPNSLGLLYSAFTFYTGFKINSGEYKLMGLAPYGEPRYAGLIRDKLLHLNEDGSCVLNQQFFNYTRGLTMTNERFHALFGGPPRAPESLITQKEMDIAASIQSVLDEAVLKMARYVRRQSAMPHLVLAGGVALNVVSTGLLSRAGIFDKLWIQPASGDAGGALGAALWAWHVGAGQPRHVAVGDAMQGAFLGPEIAPASPIDDALLRRLGGVWRDCDEDALQELVAAEIAAGKIVAIARGRMEFGPRALGARSILGDARSPEMQSRMNLKIKFRESFRPFAPMVLEEDAADYFDLRQESPYMLLAYPVAARRRLPAPEAKDLFGIDLLKVPRSEVPAVTHVDYSARVQTVDPVRHPFMHGALRHFKALTGCPVVVNTSFNVRGEPIVNTPEDAYRCFMATDIDALVIGNRFFDKRDQTNLPLNDTQRQNWLQRFDLD